MRIPAVLVALVLCGCGAGNGPDMRPGEDCLRCHSSGSGHNARIWSFAGTIYTAPDAGAGAGVLGAHLHVTDANGWSFVLRSNAAGNFYSAEPVRFPLRVCAERGGAQQCMTGAADSGRCNGCHGVPPTDGAIGRIWVP